jgi:hypothetical protein
MYILAGNTAINSKISPQAAQDRVAGISKPIPNSISAMPLSPTIN